MSHRTDEMLRGAHHQSGAVRVLSPRSILCVLVVMLGLIPTTLLGVGPASAHSRKLMAHSHKISHSRVSATDDRAASDADGSGASPNMAPSVPPVTWCETGLPTSPYTTAPRGAVVIPAGDDSGTAPTQTFTVQPNTTYWFAPGTHTLGTSAFAQIRVAPGDTFIGAPGSIIDGQGDNNYTFEAASGGSNPTPDNATIEYLTVQNFVAGSGGGVVGEGSYNGWTIQDNLVQDNPDGAGVIVGDNSVVEDNCLEDNGEYGFNGQGNNSTLTLNDINDNNNLHAFDFPDSPPDNRCGCSGAGKWWEGLNDATTDNYIHDNQGVGIWYDTNNAGALISGNYVSDNWGVGIQYELSYNAQITDNTLVGNAIGEGKAQTTPGFPDGAIYISESGGYYRVASRQFGAAPHSWQRSDRQLGWRHPVGEQRPLLFRWLGSGLYLGRPVRIHHLRMCRASLGDEPSQLLQRVQVEDQERSR